MRWFHTFTCDESFLPNVGERNKDRQPHAGCDITAKDRSQYYESWADGGGISQKKGRGRQLLRRRTSQAGISRAKAWRSKSLGSEELGGFPRLRAAEVS